MRNVRGFHLPQDLYLLGRVGLLSLRYLFELKRRSMGTLLDEMTGKRRSPDRVVLSNHRLLDELHKVWRGSEFFLRHVFRNSRPCLPRSLVLYHWCLAKGLDARVCIGVSKDGGTLKGHAWVLLDGIPFKEDTKILAAYKTMMVSPLSRIKIPSERLGADTP